MATKRRTAKSPSTKQTRTSQKISTKADKSKVWVIGGVVSVGILAGGIGISQISKTQTSTSSIMSGIEISEAEEVAYSRDDYQPDWEVGGGCDIRSQILSSSSLVNVEYSTDGCTVIDGTWQDPYSGKTVSGNPYRGDGTNNDLDIDHIIPLKYVNEHGGYEWTDEKKREYGASLDGLKNGIYVAVLASENRSKGDDGPSEYYPSNPDYYCEYSRLWRDVARLYDISLSQADYDTVARVLVECGVKQ